MKKQILINVEAGERRIAMLSDNKLDDYFVERQEQQSIVGNIYKGVVESVVPAIGAAFVNYGTEKNGFLYISDALEAMHDFDEGEVIYDSGKNKSAAKIEDLLKKKQQVLIQVVKDEIGTKGARLTTNVSIPGRFLVFMPTTNKIGISRKIRDAAERKKIKEYIRSFRLPPGAGLIARTVAAGCSKRDLARDVKYLTKQWAHVKHETSRKPAPALLWQELDLISKVMRDIMSEKISKVVIDEKGVFKRIRHLVSYFAPELKSRIEFYKGDTALFEKYAVEKEIDKIFQRKVFIKCGGYITIEQTEGMVAIDVNSGRFTRKKDPEEMIFRVNSEAAVEVARQLRLRDVGGIVIIDFIDMEDQRHRRSIFNTLNQELRKDRAKTHIVSHSELDIIELTRQRTFKSLESASYQNCPYCAGRGLIKSPETISLLAIRKLKEQLKGKKGVRSAELIAHPEIAAKLRQEKMKALQDLRRRFRARIVVLDNSSFHLEDIEIKLT